MGAFSLHIPLALEGQWSGPAAVGVVLTAAAIFIGTVYYILATLFGWRRAYYVTMVSLMGFIILLSLVWLVGVPGSNPGFGPRGREPEWIPFLSTSAFGQDFKSDTAAFPNAWDQPGKKYFGNPDKGETGAIEAAGEIETLKGTVKPALAGYFQKRQGSAKEEDYDFRVAGTAEQEAELTPEEKAVPVATIRFKDAGGGNLLVGIQLPSTAKHPAITVFAYRDKGAVFLPSLYFLITSLVLFAVHLWLLARDEIKQKVRDGAIATAPTQVTTGS